MRTKSEKAINYDLWEQLLEETQKHKIKFNWVKWHNWHKENERCDELATKEILKNTDILIKSKNNPHSISFLEKDIEWILIKTQKKIKMSKENQPCKKCATPIIRVAPKKKNTKNKSFYYDWFLTCPNCKTNYFVEEAKVYL